MTGPRKKRKAAPGAKRPLTARSSPAPANAGIFDEPAPEREKLPPVFAKLEAEAGAAEDQQTIDDLPPAPPPELVVDYLGQARDLVAMTAGMLLPFYPELVPIWTEPKQNAVANALAPVLAKYKLQIPDLLAQYAPELGLAIVVIPLAIETRRALQAAAIIKAENEARTTQGSATTSSSSEPPHYAPAAHKANGAPMGQQQIIPRTDPNSLHTRA